MVSVLSCLLATSCKKEVPVEQFTFKNAQSSDISIKLYKNYEDCYRNLNEIKSFKVSANSSVEIPLNEVQLAEAIDWYSDDFYYTNWRRDNSSIQDYSLFTKTNNSWDNQYYGKYLMRKTLLPGDITKTIWKAVDATLSNVGQKSSWPNMNANERNVTVIFKRDFTALVCFDNDTTETKYRCNVYDTQHSLNLSLSVEKVDVADLDLYEQEGVEPATDTLELRWYRHKYNYVLKRQ